MTENIGPIIAPSAFNGARMPISKYAQLLDSAALHRDCLLSGSAVVKGHAMVSDHAIVAGRAVVEGFALILGFAQIRENAHVYGDAVISNGVIGRDADVSESNHHIFIEQPFPCKITVYRTKDGARVQAGCQNFPLDDSEEKMEALSHQHGFSLPANWKTYLAAFRETASTWH